ncbi:hypothetical protein SEPCBS119000_006553, partial [Sporothrix epigloea]
IKGKSIQHSSTHDQCFISESKSLQNSRRLPKLTSTPFAQQQQQETIFNQEQQIIVANAEISAVSTTSEGWPHLPMIARMYSIEPEYQERGIAFFISQYVTVDNNVSHQRFDFLYDVWTPKAPFSESQIDSVMASMTAVGLVGISQLTYSKEVIESARKSYGTALCLTNAALRDREEAVQDKTMLSILILGVYEMMAEPGLETMRTWQNHLNGAVELSKLRGAGQFRTRAGMRMFNMLCESVTLSCVQKQIPMPPGMVTLQEELLSTSLINHGPGEFGKIDLSKPVFELVQACHDLRMAGLSNNIDVLLGRLNQIEAGFNKPLSTFAKDCQYKELRVRRAHNSVFYDVCHVYSSIAMLSAWNWLRTGRILVLETILAAIQRYYPDPGEHGERVPAQYMNVFQQACSNLDSVYFAIVASMPQQCGLLDPTHPCFESLRAMPVAEHLLLSQEGGRAARPPVQSLNLVAGSIQTPLPEAGDMLSHTRAFCEDDDEKFSDVGGPSLKNPTRARSMEEEAERFMLLASATNPAVWPLFAVGVGSVCSPQLREYVVAQLCTIFDETGLRQAWSVASIVREQKSIESPWKKLYLR